MKTIITCLLLVSAAFASQTTLTGTIKDGQGNPLNGTLVMRLPVPAQDTTTSVAVAPIPVYFRVVNGAVTGGAKLYDVATLQPSGLYYIGRAYDAAGILSTYGNYVVTGASFDIGAAVPTVVTTSNVSYVSPVTTNTSNVFTVNQFFQSITSRCAPAAVTGFIRLCSTDQVFWRNNGNSADQGIFADTSDRGNWSFAGGLLTNGTIPDIFLGGITASFPRIKRNGTALNFRLADDSADAPITAGQGTFSGPVAGTSGAFSLPITSTSSTYVLGGTELSTPANPSAGSQKGYFKAGKGLCALDGSGNEYCTVKNTVTQIIKKTSSTCTTGASSYDNCNDTLTWPVAFSDTAYAVTCSGVAPGEVGAGNDAPTLNVVSYTTTTVTVITQTQRSQTAHFTEMHCIGIHP